MALGSVGKSPDSAGAARHHKGGGKAGLQRQGSGYLGRRSAAGSGAVANGNPNNNMSARRDDSPMRGDGAQRRTG